MRDLDISNRDLFGRVTFGIKSSAVTSIELLIQKITILLLSDSKETYFGSVIGGDISYASRFNYDNINSDFKIFITNSIDAIKKKINEDETLQNVPYSDRLKSIVVKDILFDKTTLQVSLSLTITSYSTSKTIILPAK